MTLPPPDPSSEDAFVAEWTGRDDMDGLVAVISAAVEARRPALSARLFGLLDGAVELEAGGPLDRARRAAQLLLHRRDEARVAWCEFEDAWAALRRRRMTRIRKRMRDVVKGKPRRIGRLDGKRRR